MKSFLEKKLGEVGVTINGDKPYDVQVRDPIFYPKIYTQQSLGAGEAYMDGIWECEKLDELFFRVCRAKIEGQFYSQLKIKSLYLRNSVINQQARDKSNEVAEVHYNLGNRLFELMLGKSLAYTCGYWKNANSLDEAQFAKYELVCRKLQLKAGERVLELGCGMGGLAKYMAEHYGCEVVAFDIGSGPAHYAMSLCKDLPVKIYQCDYRDVHIYNPNHEKFDKLVSVGVLEHIGYKNYDLFLQICRAFIKDGGIFLLHSIGGNTSKNYCDPWIDKYIFPHGMLPSLQQVGAALENKFIVEDYHNFGAYYDKTLMAWYKNLNDHWPELKSNYDERFHRMMNYYLLSCAGSFRARAMQLWQFVLTPDGIINGYDSIR